MIASVLLIRHCQSTGQAPDAALTAAGMSAAIDLARRLKDLRVDAAFSSPFRRARETLHPFAQDCSITTVIDDRLAERRLSASPQDDWLEHIRLSFGDLDHRLPGGESLREAQARGIAAILDIASAGHRLPAAATHGNLLSAVLRSIDDSFGFESWRNLTNPDLFKVAVENGRLIAFERISR